MSTYIPAKSLQPDDVIVWGGEERTVNYIEKYRKQGRKWLNICLYRKGVSLVQRYDDVAVPADAMVQWKGQALF